MVSKIQRSSPCNADSMASAKLDLSKLCVMASDPLHNVDNKLIVVLTEAVVDLAASAPALDWAARPAVANLLSNSWVRPWLARGTGSTFLRIKRSASEAKHFKAPSATTWSSPLDKRLLKHSTHSPRLSSWGS